MKKALKDMSNEELWQLFPIIIEKHNPDWKRKYREEKRLITEAIGADNIRRISHIGSTSVPGLVAKPTIDILVEIGESADTDAFESHMCSTGYLHSPQPENTAPHIMFLKGYTPEGFRGQVFHVHPRFPGDWDELYFRDYLISHPETAEEYGELKLQLREKFEHDRDSYTHAKTGFIKEVTEKARELMAGRYQPH
ncbi:MAG: GrpB family protein [Chitinispirillaceae bacterium]